MILRSFESEKINISKTNFLLFYGNNEGAKEEVINNIFKKEKFENINKYEEKEILENPKNFFDGILSKSLFEKEKIIVIKRVTEKLYKIIEELDNKKIDDIKFFLKAGSLEKKSKLRNLFEKDKEKIIVPCYKDNDSTIKKLISKNLKDYLGLNSELVEVIHNSCGNDRIKLNNEILKIKTFFSNKKLIKNELQKLLNLKEDNDFNLIRDASISGQTSKTNELLNSEIIEREKLAFYIASINQRLIRLKEVEGNNKYDAVNNLKPPIFWKDKPIFLQQTNLWNKNKIDLALKKSYEVEIKIKSNINLNKEIIFKKFLVDICCIANAA